MNERRFLNQHQPQTLVNATLLCYIDAFFGLVGGVPTKFAFFTMAGLAAGGYGIANEKRWGYALALVAAGLQLAVFVATLGFDVLAFPWILTLMFDVLLVALLVHPQSRDYQRIWFK